MVSQKSWLDTQARSPQTPLARQVILGILRLPTTLVIHMILEGNEWRMGEYAVSTPHMQLILLQQIVYLRL